MKKYAYPIVSACLSALFIGLSLLLPSTEFASAWCPNISVALGLFAVGAFTINRSQAKKHSKVSKVVLSSICSELEEILFRIRFHGSRVGSPSEALTQGTWHSEMMMPYNVRHNPDFVLPEVIQAHFTEAYSIWSTHKFDLAADPFISKEVFEKLNDLFGDRTNEAHELFSKAEFYLPHSPDDVRVHRLEVWYCVTEEDVESRIQAIEDVVDALDGNTWHVIPEGTMATLPRPRARVS